MPKPTKPALSSLILFKCDLGVFFLPADRFYGWPFRPQLKDLAKLYRHFTISLYTKLDIFTVPRRLFMRTDYLKRQQLGIHSLAFLIKL